MAKAMKFSQAPDALAAAVAQMAGRGISDIEGWQWVDAMTSGQPKWDRELALAAYLRHLSAVSNELVRTVLASGDTKLISPLFESPQLDSRGWYVQTAKVTDPAVLEEVIFSGSFGASAVISSDAGAYLDVDVWMRWAQSAAVDQVVRYRAALAGWLPVDVRAAILESRTADGSPLPPGKPFGLGWWPPSDAMPTAVLRVWVEGSAGDLLRLFGAADLFVLATLLREVGFSHPAEARMFLRTFVEYLDTLGTSALGGSDDTQKFYELLWERSAGPGEFPYSTASPLKGDVRYRLRALDEIRRHLSSDDAVAGLLAHQPPALLRLLRADFHGEPVDALVEEVRKSRPVRNQLAKMLRVARTEDQRLLVLEAGAGHHSAATLRKLAEFVPAVYAAGRMPLTDALAAYGGEGVAAWAAKHNVHLQLMLELSKMHPGLTLNDLVELLAPV